MLDGKLGPRSGKQDTSMAYSHGKDLNKVMEIEEFKELVKADDVIKPVAIILCDGGADENPRLPKTLYVAIQHFKFTILMSSLFQPWHQVGPLTIMLRGDWRHSTKPSPVCFSSIIPVVPIWIPREGPQTWNWKRKISKWQGRFLLKFVVSEYIKSAALNPVPYEEKWVSSYCRIPYYFLQNV